jgi:hypothetical protein
LIALIAVSPIGAQLPPDTIAASTAPTLQLRMVESDAGDAGVPVSSHSGKGFVVEVTDSTGATVPEAAVAFRLPEGGPTGTFADGSHASVTYTDAAGRARISGILWGNTAGAAELRITAAKGPAHAGLLLQQTLTPLSAAPTPATPVQPGTLKASAPKSVNPAINPAVNPMIVVTARSGASAPVTQAVLPKDGPKEGPKDQPAVTITNASPGHQPHSKKWLIIALVAVGAGAGAAFAFQGKGSPATPATPSLSIGSPTISVGH